VVGGGGGLEVGGVFDWGYEGEIVDNGGKW